MEQALRGVGGGAVQALRGGWGWRVDGGGGRGLSGRGAFYMRQGFPRARAISQSLDPCLALRILGHRLCGIVLASQPL